ncbi:hypothetical protein DESME_09515 [Desulfitobacterium metallireducens DSM 15288]|uniref:Uncharacterized protein n=1 Tax=Desulfitobacterium metallireducens DSM 15288 TaxID=871968 RepID=W0ECW2_9FIRM|nr:hypothetical protein DESME_09515 [Desulfitobacterium metallireducens DSM 15288]
MHKVPSGNESVTIWICQVVTDFLLKTKDNLTYFSAFVITLFINFFTATPEN